MRTLYVVVSPRSMCRLVFLFSKPKVSKRRRKKIMKSFGSVRSIFMHANSVDLVLMGLGLIGAVGDGFITPIIFFITGLLLNDIGDSSFGDKTFMHAIMKVFFSLLYSMFSVLGLSKIE